MSDRVDQPWMRASTTCRLCGNADLRSVLDLGDLCLTGTFARPGETVLSGPLELVRCHGDATRCGLVQLRHSFDPTLLYGRGYGYRSSLNRAMVEHLRTHVAAVARWVTLGPGDCVLDIGSNDGTLLGLFPAEGALLVGMDPTAERFARFYAPHVRRLPVLFDAARFRAEIGPRPVKAITSIAMLYDLERPLEFARDVGSLLAPDGVWRLEQSYLPAMLAATSYDTICHEHVEYYGMRQIVHCLTAAGLRVLEVEENDANGGSFAVTAARQDSPHVSDSSACERMLAAEAELGLDGPAFLTFARRIEAHRAALRQELRRRREAGQLVLGYGASTKGNVLLQYCGLGPDDLPAIAEVNSDKFGCVTPGTEIPIVSEDDARARRPDAFLVLPWHFRREIVRREQAFLRAGGELIFALPELEVVRL